MNKHLSSIKKTAVLVAVSWLAMPAFAGIGGFVDAQVGGGGAQSLLDERNTNSQIADGAVYLSKELGRGKLMIDIPFSFRADNVTALNGSVSAFRSFNTKAQAYVSWSYDFGLSWTLGRFDSPFINEAQDNVGLTALTTQGVIYGTLPRVHNGLMLTYGSGPLTLMGIASRQGGEVGAKASEENAEWGVLGKYSHDMGYLGAGMYLHKPQNSTETHSIIEVMAGTKMSDWTIDAQALFTKAAAAGAESGLGVGGTINYAWDKMWSFSVRPNYISKIVSNPASGAETWHTGTSTGSTFQVAVGPEAKMTDDLRMRANYTYNSVKANANATSETNSVWAVSAVYKF